VLNTAKLLKWILPLFIIAMALSISSYFIKKYMETEVFEHRMISAFGKEAGYHNVIWDDFCYIPRMNITRSGGVFSDPWNSHNPNYKGWGSFGLLPPLIGGIFIYLFHNFFLSMSIWGLINFSLIIILLYHIFRTRPFAFSQAASIIGAFLLLNLLWFGGLKFSARNTDILPAFRLGYHFSLVQLECGLLTYLPYILFLTAYWRFTGSPSRKMAVFVGGTAGLLSYFYFYHQVFAFSLIAGHMALSFALRRKREAAYLAVALTVGLIIAVPYFINLLSVMQNAASTIYMERLDYSPGRSPFQDYHWFLRLQVPFFIGIAYALLRKDAQIKWIMVRTLVVLGVAYAIVLNLRVLLGYMQAVDHFWRLSLGIPASLWSILAIFDLLRSRIGQFAIGRQVVYFTAALLPIFIMARTTADVVNSYKHTNVFSQLSEVQRETLEKLECLEQVLRPGEGFLTVDPSLNLHTMVNLKGLPFIAMGLSPISVKELSKRYILGAYLTGRDNTQYPPFVNKNTPGYTFENDPHKYIYINLFRYPWKDRNLEKKIKEIYQNWNPTYVDWNIWADALSTVKAVFVKNEYTDPALKRLEKLYTIEKIVSCQYGKALRVNLK
jgi:hypothetical protein